MAKLRYTPNHASSRPQNTVQRPQSNLWESTVERRAIIQSISYEGMNQSRRGRGGKRARNNPELAQVVIAGSSQCNYVYISSFIVNPMTHRIREQTNNQTIRRRKHNIIALTITRIID